MHVEFRDGLLGGKGGFGSLLRSMKPKTKPTENFEACRDLSGRILRNVYNAQRLEEDKFIESSFEGSSGDQQALSGY